MGNLQAGPPAFTSASAFCDDVWRPVYADLSATHAWGSANLETDPYRAAYRSVAPGDSHRGGGVGTPARVRCGVRVPAKRPARWRR